MLPLFMKDDCAVMIPLPVNAETTPKISLIDPDWLINRTLKEIEMVFVDDFGITGIQPRIRQSGKL